MELEDELIHDTIQEIYDKYMALAPVADSLYICSALLAGVLRSIPIDLREKGIDEAFLIARNMLNK